MVRLVDRSPVGRRVLVVERADLHFMKPRTRYETQEDFERAERKAEEEERRKEREAKKRAKKFPQLPAPRSKDWKTPRGKVTGEGFLLSWAGKEPGTTLLSEAQAEEFEAGTLGSGTPVPIAKVKAGSRQIWLFSGSILSSASLDALSPDEVEALILEKENRKRLKIARAKAVAAMADSLERSTDRRPIPREVKVAVWQRDEGKCTQCGSKAELEFDHIVPLAMGGSNTERNLQLLCAACNREKGASL